MRERGLRPHDPARPVAAAGGALAAGARADVGRAGPRGGAPGARSLARHARRGRRAGTRRNGACAGRPINSGSTYSFSLANGSYKYVVNSSEAGYVVIQDSTQFSINGRAKTMNIDFVGTGGKVKVNFLWFYFLIGAIGLIAILILISHRKK